MKDIVKYLEREIRTRQEQLEYCSKYNDPRQAKFIEKNIERLHTSINILSAKVDTDNKTKALNICDVSQLCELLFEFNEWVANDRRSTTVKQLVDGFIKEKFK